MPATTKGFIEPAGVDFDWRAIRRELEREIGPGWFAGNFGPAGVMFLHRPSRTSVLVSQSDIADGDGTEWVHASIAHTDQMPTYRELVILHRAVFGDRYAYQIFVPQKFHVNIHANALHLWGRADGKPVTPEFGSGGTI